MINKDRLAQTFKHLVSIDSVSKEEGAVCCEIREILKSMGAKTVVDGAETEQGATQAILSPGLMEAGSMKARK